MASSENQTYVDPESVRLTADRIGELMNDLQIFYTLADLETKAGDFSTASWLQELVHDRQSGLLQHAANVKLVSDDIKTSLYDIVSTFESTDQSNADNLERQLYHDVNELQIKAHESTEQAKGAPEPAKPQGQA